MQRNRIPEQYTCITTELSVLRAYYENNSLNCVTFYWRLLYIIII